MHDSRVPTIGAVISIEKQLVRWLHDEALPLWDEHGVDRASGGYFEQMSFDEPLHLRSASGPLRRGRVVARQIYVFEVGRRLGWVTGRSDPVRHGCEFLFARLLGKNGSFHAAVHAGSHQPEGVFSLYEHAFFLFALAQVNGSLGEQFPVARTAEQGLEHLWRILSRQNGGFDESIPPTMPLRSNPHMHLLEAALAWIQATDGTLRQRPWIELASHLVSLCLAHFIDADTGGIRECFGFEWRPMADESGRVIEPGHQFEWAWLLLQWAGLDFGDAVQRSACVSAARRLVDLAERCGVDAERNVAINAVWDDLNLKDADAKLWPQTERTKAWCAVLELARSAGEAELACRQLVLAGRGLAQYLHAAPSGLWRETLSADGMFSTEPTKASSFYHIVCAIDVLRRTVSGCRTNVLYSAPHRSVP